MAAEETTEGTQADRIIAALIKRLKSANDDVENITKDRDAYVELMTDQVKELRAELAVAEEQYARVYAHEHEAASLLDQIPVILINTEVGIKIKAYLKRRAEGRPHNPHFACAKKVELLEKELAQLTMLKQEEETDHCDNCDSLMDGIIATPADICFDCWQQAQDMKPVIEKIKNLRSSVNGFPDHDECLQFVDAVGHLLAGVQESVLTPCPACAELGKECDTHRFDSHANGMMAPWFLTTVAATPEMKDGKPFCPGCDGGCALCKEK